MQTPRRFLPSIALLSAFEAAARTRSFTAAARELSLTQSAISRQIRLLEAQLGVELFVRERQTVRPMPAGEAGPGQATAERAMKEPFRRRTSVALACDDLRKTTRTPPPA